LSSSDEWGLSTFADHLHDLGLESTELTYKRKLDALDGVDNWTAEDRMSWALGHKGIPETDKIKLDLELWLVKTTLHPNREQLCVRFEDWLQQENTVFIDSVFLDSLLM